MKHLRESSTTVSASLCAISEDLTSDWHLHKCPLCNRNTRFYLHLEALHQLLGFKSASALVAKLAA